MELTSKILVTGAAGMAGSAVVRELKQQGYTNVIGIDIDDADLRFYYSAYHVLSEFMPDYVFHIAAKVGGIHANDTKGGEFIHDNLLMQCNVLEICRLLKVKKLIFCGSACIYPKLAESPISESALLTGLLEETNKPYAVAKIAGVTMCQAYRKQYGCDFISIMPTNLYGPGDNFHATDSHVMPALIRRFHEAKINNAYEVHVWGDGTPKREFLHIDDLANAMVFLMNNYSGFEPVNVGTGLEIPIGQLVNYIQNIVEYDGMVKWDKSQPNGVMSRRLDVSRINKLGWASKKHLYDGISETYEWFVKNYENIRK